MQDCPFKKIKYFCRHTPFKFFYNITYLLIITLLPTFGYPTTQALTALSFKPLAYLLEFTCSETYKIIDFK